MTLAPTRTATNTVANLAERQRRAAGNKRHMYENAHAGSAVSTARSPGANATDDGAARKTLDRRLGLCSRLMH